MRAVCFTAGLAALVSATLALTATTSWAATVQTVSISLFDVDGFDYSDSVRVADGQPVDRDILAMVNAPGARATASIDRFGNVTLNGASVLSSPLSLNASVSSDEFFSPFSLPAKVSGRVLVDGGSLRLLGTEDAKLTLSLGVSASGSNNAFIPGDFGSSIKLVMDDDFGTASTISRGLPLNTTVPPQAVANQIDIEPTLVEFEVGPVPSGEAFGLSYLATIRVDPRDGLLEIAEFSFSDPFSLFFEPLTFTPLDSPLALPSPPTALLLLGGVAGLALRRRLS